MMICHLKKTAICCNPMTHNFMGT